MVILIKIGQKWPRSDVLISGTNANNDMNVNRYKNVNYDPTPLIQATGLSNG